MTSPAAAQLALGHQRDLLTIGAGVASGVTSIAMGADPAAIDTWFLSSLDGLMARVQVGYAQSRQSGLEYVARRAAQQRAKVDLRAGSLSTEQARTSLRVTGPVAFKQAISAGQDSDQAIRTMATRLSGSASRLSLAGERDVVEQTMRHGSGIKGYRRVLGGPGCGFCAMLASRGAVYGSLEAAAGMRYHDHCRCHAEPLFRHESEPADVRRLQRQWRRVTAGESDKANAWRQYWESADRTALGPRALEPVPTARAAAEAGTGGAADRIGLRSAVTIRPELRQARTVADVEDVFEHQASLITEREIGADFHGSVETAREHAEGLLRGLERFPDADLTAVRSTKLATGSYAEHDGGVITFSREWTGLDRRDDYLIRIRLDVQSKFHPAGMDHPAGIAIHEFGHVIDVETLGDIAEARIARLVRIQAAAAGVTEDEFIATQISRYAAKDSRELVAEAFADVMLNGEAASQLSRDIFAILEREYVAGGRNLTRTERIVSRAAADKPLARQTVAELKLQATARGIEVPPRASKQVLIGLIEEADRVAARLAGRTAAEQATADIVIENRIRAMYTRLVREAKADTRYGQPALGIRIQQLREALPDVARADLDRVLLAMDRREGMSLFPDENQKLMDAVAGYRESAVKIGRKPYHFLEIRDPAGLKPLPVPAPAIERAVVRSGRDALSAGQIDVSGVTRVPGVTAAERAAVDAYLSDAQRLNALIREGRTGSKTIKELDRLIGRSTLDSDIEVWRGLRSGEGLLGDMTGDLVGREVTDAGFFSTSASRTTAEEFAGSFGDPHPVVLRVVVPQGSNALTVSEWGTGRAIGGQAEVLLPRGSRIRVVADHGVTPHPGVPQGIRVLDVEIVPRSGAPAAPTAAPVTVPTDVTKMTLAQLRELAASRGIDTGGASKTMLVDMLSDTGKRRWIGRIDAPAAELKRLNAIAQAQGQADVLAEVLELTQNGASTRALAARIRSVAAERNGYGVGPQVTDEFRDRLLAAVESGDVQTLARQMAADAGIELTGEAGAVVRFDRATMRALEGDLPDGTMVTISRPGARVKVGTKTTQLERATVQKASAEEAAAAERKALREAARERNRVIESAHATERLLGELDELIAKGAAPKVLAERLTPAVFEPGQAFAGADPAVVEALRAALASGDPAKLRTAITRGGTRVKVKPIGKAGAKAKFDPATMESVSGGDIPAGAQVEIVRRGSTLTLPDGTTLTDPLTRAQVRVVGKPAKPSGRPPAKPAVIRDLIDADDATIEAAMRDVYEGKFGPYTTKVQVKITRAGVRVSKTGRETPIEPRISIEGRIYDSTGHEIGDFGRSIGPVTFHYADGSVRREVWADHAIVQLEDKYQGKGFGGAFNGRVIEWYRASGVHGISLNDHNGYVWASQGFGFGQGGVVPEHTVEALRDLIADIRAGKTRDKFGVAIPKALREARDLEAQLAAADDILARIARFEPGEPGYPTAYELSQVGRTTQRGKTSTWFGKFFMFNNGSTSELVLNPGEGVVLSA